MTDAKSMSMSIKAFFLSHDGNNTEEVRRFGIPEGVSTNFDYLQQRVKSVFGLQPNEVINIYWEDDEGDKIIISSDDELLEAISECICRQQQQILKLYISQKKVIKDEHNTKEKTKNVHKGITCDGCDKGIPGFRFKCLTCFDYDLCAACHLKGIHNHHEMCNLGLPKMKFHGEPTGMFEGNDAEMNNDCDNDKGPGGSCPGRHGKKGGRGGRNRCGGARGGRRPWGHMGAGGAWAGPHVAFAPGPPMPPMADLSECFEQFFPEEVRGRMGEANRRTAGHVADFVKNIWDSWSGTFESTEQSSESKKSDPKPSQTTSPKENVINIDIEMGDDGQVKNCSVKKNVEVKKSSSSSNEKDSSPIEKDTNASQKTTIGNTPQKLTTDDSQKTTINNTPQKVATDDSQEVAMDSTPQNVTIDASQEVVMDIDGSVEDWTLVAKEASAGSSSPLEVDCLSIDDDIQVLTYSKKELEEMKVKEKSTKLYPELPRNETCVAVPQTSSAATKNNSEAAAAVIVEELSPEEKRIADSLRYMTNMGYSDEGGWLTRLLELKKGDINQVLDILMGPRKN